MHDIQASAADGAANANRQLDDLGKSLRENFAGSEDAASSMQDEIPTEGDSNPERSEDSPGDEDPPARYTRIGSVITFSSGASTEEPLNQPMSGEVDLTRDVRVSEPTAASTASETDADQWAQAQANAKMVESETLRYQAAARAALAAAAVPDPAAQARRILDDSADSAEPDLPEEISVSPSFLSVVQRMPWMARSNAVAVLKTVKRCVDAPDRIAASARSMMAAVEESLSEAHESSGEPADEQRQ